VHEESFWTTSTALQGRRVAVQQLYAACESMVHFGFQEADKASPTELTLVNAVESSGTEGFRQWKGHVLSIRSPMWQPSSRRNCRPCDSSTFPQKRVESLRRNTGDDIMIGRHRLVSNQLLVICPGRNFEGPSPD